jgi:uncharacterized heparinase superfamily protein
MPEPSQGEADVLNAANTGSEIVVRPSGVVHDMIARASLFLYQLSWRTPLHGRRISGKLPLKLLAAPTDPLTGNETRGTAIRMGKLHYLGMDFSIADGDFAEPPLPPAFLDYLHRFDWLRDLGMAANRSEGAPIAAQIADKWLSVHADKPRQPAWSIATSAWRFINMAAWSPYLLTSADLIYRSKILNHFARTARHLDHSAIRATQPFDRVAGWIGVCAAALLLPEGKSRRAMGEHGLAATLPDLVYPDGGVITRAPIQLIELIGMLTMLRACYAARGEPAPDCIGETLRRNVPALLGLTHHDGGLGAWQGSGHINAAAVNALVEASDIRSRPSRQALDWGYQRVAAGPAVLLVDAGPPPHAKQALTGCASTLAFEFSFAKQRVIINCGGAALAGANIPASLARGLRTTAAHSTLCLDDSNSTALLANGQLGRGVIGVGLERRDIENATRIEASHDGYARAYGFTHSRLLILRSDGMELRGEDTLLPDEKYKVRDDVPAHLRFHLGPDIELVLADDARSVLMRLDDGTGWRFAVTQGTIAVEDSLWVDGDGRPNPTRQLVIEAKTAKGGLSIGWLLKFIG